MLYRMQEGHLTLDGPWQDQSVNVLVPRHLAAEGVSLVVARDVLPSGMEFGEYLGRQKQTFEKELTAYKVHAEGAFTLDQRPAHFLEFTWDNQGSAVHQMMSVILDKGLVLSLTATVRGSVDELTRKALLSTIKSFEFCAVQDASGNPAS